MADHCAIAAVADHFCFSFPRFIVFAITFKPADLYGGIGAGWTLETLRSLGNPNYPAIIWRTLWMSLLTTIICMMLATPAGYFIARLPQRWRQIMLLLVIVPFWTSFLIRIFAWKICSTRKAIKKRLLTFIGWSP